MEKNLYGYVSNIIKDVSYSSVLELIEEDRKQKLEMNPSSAFRNRKANSVSEKNTIINSILEDIKPYKIKSRELKDANRKLGTFLITNCNGCRDEHDVFKEHIYLDKEGNPIEKTWGNYFLYQDKDYCSSYCEFNQLEDKPKDFVAKYNTYYDNRFKTLTEHTTMGIEYRVALEQKQSLLESFEKIIKTHKETVAILVFKKNDIQWHINIIQLSVIVVSTFITIFETSQNFLEQYVNKQILTIFPIVLSSYIGLILAIGRFFKYDDKNEKIIKLIEKYSFIINKFRQKSDNFEGFDFKLKDMKKWEELLDRDEKDNIGDILLKANEEKDLVLKPKEAVFYKKKYTKTRLKEIIESKNFNELGDLINKDEHPNMQITKFTQNIIVKRNFCKYYCCFQWLCYDRDYVDYDKTVLKNAIFFLKTNDIYDKDISNNKQPTNQSNNENKELEARVEAMDKKITTLQMENENGKRIEKIRAEEERKRQKKEHRLGDLRNTKMKSTSPTRPLRTLRKSTAKRDWEEKGRRRKGRRGKHQEEDEDDPLHNPSDEEDQEVSDANIPILLGDKVRQEKEETIQEEVERLDRELTREEKAFKTEVERINGSTYFTREEKKKKLEMLHRKRRKREEKETIQEETEELPRVQKKLEKIRRKRREQEEKELEERIKKDRQKEKTIQENSDCVIDISSALQEDISNITLDISEYYPFVPDTNLIDDWANSQFFKTFGRKGLPDEITTFLQEHGEPSEEILTKFIAEKKN